MRQRSNALLLTGLLATAEFASGSTGLLETKRKVRRRQQAPARPRSLELPCRVRGRFPARPTATRSNSSQKAAEHPHENLWQVAPAFRGNRSFGIICEVLQDAESYAGRDLVVTAVLL